MTELISGLMPMFKVDPDELDATIAEMERCEHALALLTREVELETARLHGLWHGAAADAHRVAQAEWQRGLAEMRAALAAYRMSVRRAHANYLDAATVNARMWMQTG